MASKGSEVGVSDGKIQIFLEGNKKMFRNRKGELKFNRKREQSPNKNGKSKLAEKKSFLRPRCKIGVKRAGSDYKRAKSLPASHFRGSSYVPHILWANEV